MPEPEPIAAPVAPSVDAAAASVSVSALPDQDARVLQRLCSQYRALKAQLSDLETQSKPIKAAIDAIAARLALPEIEGDSWKVSYRRACFEPRIVPELLLDHSVDIRVIEACTRMETTRKAHYEVLGKKEKEVKNEKGKGGTTP